MLLGLSCQLSDAHDSNSAENPAWGLSSALLFPIGDFVWVVLLINNGDLRKCHFFCAYHISNGHCYQKHFVPLVRWAAWGPELPARCLCNPQQPSFLVLLVEGPLYTNTHKNNERYVVSIRNVQQAICCANKLTSTYLMRICMNVRTLTEVVMYTLINAYGGYYSHIDES